MPFSGTGAWRTARRWLLLGMCGVMVPASCPLPAAVLEISGYIYTRSVGLVYVGDVPGGSLVMPDATGSSTLTWSKSVSFLSGTVFSNLNVQASVSAGQLRLSMDGSASCTAGCQDEFWYETIDGSITLLVRDRVRIEGASEGSLRMRSRLDGQDIRVSGVFQSPYDQFSSGLFEGYWNPENTSDFHRTFRYYFDTGGEGETIDGRWEGPTGGEGETIDGRWEGGEGETIDGKGITEVPVRVAEANLIYYLQANIRCLADPGTSCSASADLFNTAQLGKFEFYNPDGTLNPNVRILSESGFDYTAPISGDFTGLRGGDPSGAVPEPSTFVLLASALVLLFRRNRSNSD